MFDSLVDDRPAAAPPGWFDQADPLAGVAGLGPGLSAAPGAALAVAVEAEYQNLADLDGRLLIETVVACRRLRSWAQAVELEAIAALAQARVDEQVLQGQAWPEDPGADPEVLGRRCAVEELAAECGASAASMWSALGVAEDLAAVPQVLAALRAGAIDWAKAKAFRDAVAGLPQGQAAAVVQRVLPTAGHRPPARVRESLRRAVKRIAPRHDPDPDAPGPEGRGVWFTPEPKGMCRLTALLPADQAMGVKAALEALAAVSRTDGDERTTSQRRADALADAVANALAAHLSPAGEPVGHRRAQELLRPQVMLTVPITALAPELAAAAPVEAAVPVLRGYGPISDDMARDLAVRGTWRCAATDQHGTLLGLGATGYTPAYRAGRGLTRYVDTRDQHCRFPGCRRPAHRADHDHRTPYPAGSTCECNLIVLCRAHHLLKHRTGFHPEPSTDPHDPPGTLIWTTPTGTHHRSTPPRIGPAVPGRAGARIQGAARAAASRSQPAVRPPF